MTTEPSSMDLATIAERLVIVENELARLKQCIQPSDQPWYLQHAGRFADDPDYEEIVRLGQEIRKSDTFQ